MKWNEKVFGFGLLFVLGLILAFAPIKTNGKGKPDVRKLLVEMQRHNYYVSAEDLAHKIIDKEPGIVVVDVRNEDDFNRYHIPGSWHVPLKKLINNRQLQDMAQDNTIILVSNGNTLAAQAWLLLKQNGYKDVYILAGGMNHWVKVFSNPTPPKGAYTDDELFRYEFRKAAGPVMMGKMHVRQQEEHVQTKIKRPLLRKRHRPAKKLDEGC